MEIYPKLHLEEYSLVIEFSSGSEQANRQPIDMVLDFDQFGDIIGIEIINLMLHAGKNCLEFISKAVQTDSDKMRYAYDDDSDCFILQLRKDRSINQKTVEGCVFLDKDGRIISLRVSWDK